MGTCQSTGHNLARALEDTCGSSVAAGVKKRQHRKRRRRNQNVSLSPSSSSSSLADGLPAPAALANRHAQQVLGVHEQADSEPKSGHKAPITPRNESANDARRRSKVDFCTGQKTDQAQPQQPQTNDTDWDPAKLQKLKEGVDFIETEEDAKAVEAATLKIQSTFRGKKIRSKLGGGSGGANASEKKTSDEQKSRQDCAKDDNRGVEAARELSKKVAEMQVNDKKEAEQQLHHMGGPGSTTAGSLADDEAARAATKIQAGFKGYKTRKELEGKLPAGGGNGALPELGADQQMAPAGKQHS